MKKEMKIREQKTTERHCNILLNKTDNSLTRMSKESRRKHKSCTENENGVIFTAMKDTLKVIRK